ncbi:Hypothetical protein PBC10988_37470 [Planctomycetales bacterium 10988]|nr:Hypothetical protein PBC10988_37470 [Planctomycetales bacterium 10988]
MAAQALMDAILAAPDEDNPRLVYADWLEDQEDPRGEWIRIQVELARLEQMPEGVFLPAWSRLKLREEELWAQYYKEWLPEPLDPTLANAFVYRFRRGFAEECRVSAAMFLQHADQLFLEVPTIRRVSFLMVSESLFELMNSEHLRKLVTLDLSMRTDVTFLRDTDIPTIAMSSCLDQVQELYLIWNRIEAQGMSSLACSSLLSRLKVLNLAENRIGSEGLQWLSQSSQSSNLERLLLEHNHIGAEGLAALAESPHWTSLQQLKLSRNNSLGRKGIESLAGAKSLNHLVSLGLQECGLWPADIEMLAQAPFAPQLKVLQLSRNRLLDEGVLRLVKSKNFENLRVLDLIGNGITDEGAKQLADCKHFDNLVALRVDFNELSSEGTQILKDRFGDEVVVNSYG